MKTKLFVGIFLLFVLSFISATAEIEQIKYLSFNDPIIKGKDLNFCADLCGGKDKCLAEISHEGVVTPYGCYNINQTQVEKRYTGNRTTVKDPEGKLVILPLVIPTSLPLIPNNGSITDINSCLNICGSNGNDGRCFILYSEPPQYYCFPKLEHPSSSANYTTNSDYQPIRNESFWEKIINWFKNLFS